MKKFFALMIICAIIVEAILGVMIYNFISLLGAI